GRAHSPPSPAGRVPRGLRARHGGESRQPLAHGCRFVIDDVVDASSRAALEGECRCGGSVLNVDERPPTVAAADQGFPPALDLDEATVEYASIGAIERTTPEHDPAYLICICDGLLQRPDYVQGATQLAWWPGIERIVLRLDGVADPGEGPPAEALRPKARHSRLPCGGEQVIVAFRAQAVADGKGALEVPQVSSRLEVVISCTLSPSSPA